MTRFPFQKVWLENNEMKINNYCHNYPKVIPEELKVHTFKDQLYNFLCRIKSSVSLKQTPVELRKITVRNSKDELNDVLHMNSSHAQLRTYEELKILKLLEDVKSFRLPNSVTQYEDVVSTLQNSSASSITFEKIINALLHYAIQYNHIDFVEWLLICGADPNNINELGDQPIHSAVLGKHLQILRLLIDFGAKVDMKNQQGAQPIHLAGEGNFLEGLELLLELTQDVNILDDVGATPIHYCCFKDSAECLLLLIEHGGNIYQPNVFGTYPIHEAISQLSLRCVKILLEYNKHDLQMSTETKQTDNTDLSVTGISVNNKSTSIFNRKFSLISNNFSINRHVSPSTPSRFSMEQRCSNHGSDQPIKPLQLIHLPDCQGFAPIHMAANSGSIELMKICLQEKANILTKVYNGQTVLHYCALRGDLECIKFIIESIQPEEIKILIECANENGETCLHLAAMQNYVNMVEYLISLGAVINKPDINGNTPIMSAAIKGSVPVCNYLLKKELKELPELLNDVDNFGFTPLHYAVELNLIKTSQFCLQFGANVTITSKDKSSPLHIAAKYGRCIYHRQY
uniref:ANK_REP_REGION domain-containing protein n=1 Tax=Trichobilharzia regenti TaxID=157069 RepID=A0AA85KEI5_TRIRE|nr:unnamed protein product [Trichobilharzia regenti]